MDDESSTTGSEFSYKVRVLLQEKRYAIQVLYNKKSPKDDEGLTSSGQNENNQEKVSYLDNKRRRNCVLTHKYSHHCHFLVLLLEESK